ncbi:MAG: transcriptional regulator [Cellvibrionales bacterium]|nr:transcriptional regulator [Cellvibrionales bacterium]
MPIYEYQCEACGHQLEALQKMSAAPLLRCPVCDKDSLKKLISAAAFKLKGSGWYETDFKNKGETVAPSTQTESNKAATSSGASSQSTE